MKGITTLIVISLSLGLVGCVNRKAQSQAKETAAIVTDTSFPVVLADAKLADLPEQLELTGAITTSDDIQIGAKSPGRLVAVMVKDGDSVSAGQVIAVQDSTQAQMQVRQAMSQANSARAQLNQAMTDARVGPQRSSAAIRASEARLAQARSSLQKAINGSRVEERKQAEQNVLRAKSDLETAEKALRRAENLYNQGAIALQELEQVQNRHAAAQAAYQTALEQQSIILSATRPEDITAAREAVRAAEEQLRIDRANKLLDSQYQDRIQAARANLTAAQEQVNIARQAVSDLTIRAAIPGRVSGRPLPVGTFLSPGTVVARVVGGQGVYYQADVTEQQVSKIKVGMPVEVRVDALEGVTIRGFVAGTNPAASSVGRLFTVRISLSERLDAVKPGMFARGRLQLGIRRDVVTVPNEAILRDGETAYLFIADGSKAKRVEVKLGLASDGKTEVSGLRAGDKVVIRGQSTLVDGVTIKPETDEPKKPEATSGN